MDYKADWFFSGLPSNRIEMLSSCPPYADIIRRIVKHVEPQDINFCIDPGWLQPVTEALRPLFYISAGEELADLFYNGVCGYRAQYYRSPENGEDANRYAIQQLESKLLDAARIADWRAPPDPDQAGGILHMEKAQVLASLRFSSAKIWGDETEGEMSCVTKSADETPQIIARRWIENIKKQSRGVKAPRFSTLKFHGAFINNKNDERIPPGKESRSHDIYLYGWS